MIYVQARVIGGDEDALMARCYLAALAKIDQDATGVQIRALWLDTCAVQPEMIEQEVRGLYDLASRDLGPVQAVLRIGRVGEVVAQPCEAPYSIALTWWPAGRLSRAMRTRLDTFDAVWVPSASLTQDYPGSTVMPVPFDEARWGVGRGKVQLRPVVYVVGRWSQGEVEKQLELAIRVASELKGEVLVYSPGAPFTNTEQYRNLHGLPADTELPPIIKDPYLPETLPAVRAAHQAGTHYVSAGGFHGAVARFMGNAIVLPDGAIVAGEADDSLEDDTALADLMASQLAAIEVEPLPEPKPVAAGEGDPPPILTCIVPVRGVPVEDLEALLKTLQPQLTPSDEVIISAQGESAEGLAELRELAVARSLTLVEDDYAGVWNIARARNAGLLAARLHNTMAPRYVICLDADLRVPPGWVREARKIITERCYRETVVFVPQAVDLDGSRPRIASGAAFLPRGFVETARGWDEQYFGYGSEDLDLIHRLRNDLGAQLVMLDAKALEPLEHVSHEERPERREYGAASVKRLEARIRGDARGAVNLDAESWRERWVERRDRPAPCFVSVRDGYPQWEEA